MTPRVQMVSGLAQSLLRMPSAQRFLGDIVEAVRRRQCVIVELPDSIGAEEVEDSLLFSLDHAGFKVWPVDPQRRRPNEPVAVFLAREEGEGRPASDALSFEWLLTGDLSRGDVILFRGNTVEMDWGVSQWPDFLDQWARTVNALGSKAAHRASVCLITRAGKFPMELLAPSPLCVVSRWSDIPTVSEMRVACRFAGDSTDGVAKVLWREYLLPPLVGNDLELVWFLWEPVVDGTGQIVEALSEYARQRGWSRESLEDAGVREADEITVQAINWSSPMIPAKLATLWQSGLLVSSGDGGLCLHSAALAALAEDDKIRHRIWRGQVSLLLPLVDSVRLAVCEQLTARYGNAWPLSDESVCPEMAQQAASVQESPYGVELGYLLRVLQYSRRFRDEARYLGPLVRRTRAMRNDLSHYRTVEFADFRALLKEVGRARREGLALSTALAGGL